MKKIVGFFVMLVLTAAVSVAQNKVDNDRMDRDIEIAENALTTMIRLQLNQKNRYYGMDIKGNYTPGYGVTLRIPGEHNYINAIGWTKGPAVIAPGTRTEGIAIARPGDAYVVIVDSRPGRERNAASQGKQDSAKAEY